MFGGRFSQTKFSLNATIDFDARIDIMFIETIRSVVLSNQNTAVENNYRNRVTSDTILTCGIKMGNAFAEEITAITSIVRNAPVIIPFRENVYSIINTVSDYKFTALFDEKIFMKPFEAVIDTDLKLTLESKIMSNILSGIDFEFDGNYVENISADIIMTAAVALMYNFGEHISGQIIPANNVNAITAFTENINGHLFLAYDFSFGHTFRETLAATNQAAIDIRVNNDFREAIFGMTMANELDSDSMIIDVRIPKGGTLVIDSEKFIVTLNGVNIIHLHNGDFINISRNAIDMRIASGGRLNGELVYVERFL